MNTTTPPNPSPDVDLASEINAAFHEAHSMAASATLTARQAASNVQLVGPRHPLPPPCPPLLQAHRRRPASFL